ncbi:GNAT family N-acetyltransferase [Nocardiopsis tropica]|uniref:GNAT family N-acetyltransferase n=1 Tax=Tsukamurella TaxID=2060 RepID=UPI001C7CEEA9|nr:GNAT family N-acetyltransferase [Tsukamurella sp. TY48]GIZ99053.1 ribosomal-protein-alanine acetyltransferase [Tsukamurella sp. TY48]
MSDGAPDLIVRAAAATDLGAVAALGVEVQDLHFTARPDLFVAPAPDQIEAFMAAAIDQPQHHLLVAVRASEVLGFILCEQQRRIATPFRRAMTNIYIHQLAVATHARRSGVASALLAGCESLASASGASWLRLDSWAFNATAQDYFTRRGFAAMNTVFERMVP